LDDFLAPEGIITKKRHLDASIRENREGVERRRTRIGALGQENRDLSVQIERYRKTLEDLRVNFARMEAQAKSAEEQARLIRRELSGQEALLKTIRDELFLARKRLEDTDERISEVEESLAQIEKQGHEMTASLEKLEKDIEKRTGDLEGKQASIKKKTEELARQQDRLEKIHMSLIQTDTEIKNIQDNFRETHSRDLSEFEERMFQITAESPALRTELADLRASLKDLGSVNLMAPEEFAETSERYEFLSSQMHDLEKAKTDLENITAEIRAESSTLFINTYNRIKKNFHNMFRRLFGGGRAELRLSDPNHVLESGIEIYAQPPGKKLENIGLLSGGEKSMTAVALLFATYMVKPSPFCLLDEIDAALDEANVLRFVQMVREFGASSQFIIITHNKKTVTAANTLLGVTMEESGVSKIISIRLQEDATSADDALAETLEAAPVEEEVEPEEGRELPPGIDDPESVTEEMLHPITGKRD
jgi:chromosome segregation protein